MQRGSLSGASDEQLWKLHLQLGWIVPLVLRHLRRKLPVRRQLRDQSGRLLRGHVYVALLGRRKHRLGNVAVPMSRRGKILAVKWGYNPNSSSLGVDVTFLLFGMAAIALFTPIVSLFLRARRAKALPPAAPPVLDSKPPAA